LETPKAPDTPGDDERAAIDADAALREAEAFDPGEELSGSPAPGRQAGRIARQMKNFANQARDELRDELGPEFADLDLREPGWPAALNLDRPADAAVSTTGPLQPNSA